MEEQTYRDNGAIGALQDEYERALKELVECISDISEEDLHHVVDSETKDEDCRSIRTILTHVIRAGYAYNFYIRTSIGEQLEKRPGPILKNAQEYIEHLGKMFTDFLEIFDDYPDIKLEEIRADRKFIVSWGQSYDVEQMIEHAIVHILRHRRQIERFKLKLKN